MTQTELLELAKQGRPKAIAALIARSLQPKGIAARASLKSGCLQVMLEAPQVPNQKVLAEFIYQGVLKLEPQSISKVKVYGLQTGQSAPAWCKEFKLPPSAPIPTPPAVAAPTPSHPNGDAPPTRGKLARQSSETKLTPKQSRLSHPPEVSSASPETVSTPAIATPEDYQDLLRDISLFPRKGRWALDYYYAIPKLAIALVELLPSKGAILDVVALRYQGQLACLVLSERCAIGFVFPDFSDRAIKRFVLKFNKITKVVTTRRGLRIYTEKGREYRLYFVNNKLGREFVQGKFSELVPLHRGRFMPDDRYESSFTLFGYLTLILTLGVNVVGLWFGVMFLLNQLIGSPF